MDTEKINAFLHSDKMHITIEANNGRNPACEWTKLRNPVRMALNALVVHICMFIPSTRVKRGIYRLMGAKIGKNVVIAPGALIDPFFPELIEISDNSIIGWGTKILAHEFTLNNVRLGRVKIGRNTVIGAFSVVRCGVRIGENSIVAMMSFVNKDVDKFEVVGGVPDHEIMKIKEYRSKSKKR